MYSLKEFTDSDFEFGYDVLPEVRDPFVMALHECEVLLGIRLQSLKILIFPALFVVLEVLWDMITEERLEDPELEVILVVELLAFLCLVEIISAILVAVLSRVLLKFLLSECLQLKNHSIL